MIGTDSNRVLSGQAKQPGLKIRIVLMIPGMPSNQQQARCESSGRPAYRCQFGHKGQQGRQHQSGQQPR